MSKAKIEQLMINFVNHCFINFQQYGYQYLQQKIHKVYKQDDSVNKWVDALT